MLEEREWSFGAVNGGGYCQLGKGPQGCVEMRASSCFMLGGCAVVLVECSCFWLMCECGL